MSTQLLPRSLRRRTRTFALGLSTAVACVGLTAAAVHPATDPAAANVPLASNAPTPVATLPTPLPSILASPAGQDNSPLNTPTVHPKPVVKPKPVTKPVTKTQPKPATQHQAAPQSVPQSVPQYHAPAAPAAKPVVKAQPKPVVKPKPKPKPQPVSSGYSVSSWAYAVLGQLNAERAAHGQRALSMNGSLISSAHQHNLAMARANQMSHQLPGEAFFGNRILAAGYNYKYAGENVGWNSDISQSGVQQLETMMYDEGPGGGHYENIVGPHYTNVGIDVWVDTVHHKVWITEDFGSWL